MKSFLIATLRFLDSFTNICSADIVMLELDYKNLKDIDYRSRGCIEESKRLGSCYCGKYQNGKRTTKVSSNSDDEILNEELPF